jgi:hypothetical protein
MHSLAKLVEHKRRVIFPDPKIRAMAEKELHSYHETIKNDKFWNQQFFW